MSGVQQIAVTTGEDGMRLDRWFKVHFPALTHGRLEKLLRTGQVRLDGARVKAAEKLATGQVIRVPPLHLDQVPERTTPEKTGPSSADRAYMKNLILHMDDHLIALDKPPGLPVQGGTGTERHIDGLLDTLSFRGERPRLVHRLDRDTSGVLLLARTRQAAEALTRAFRDRSTQKLYWAVTAGVPERLEGVIDVALAKLPGRGDGGRHERMVAVDDEDDDGKRAITRYQVMQHAAKKAAFVALEPLTGRTHQIRAHLAAIGAPVAGDHKYGGAGARLDGEGIAKKLHLHAREITIPHPNGGQFSIDAPLPKHMRQTFDFFGFDPYAENPFAGQPFARGKG